MVCVLIPIYNGKKLIKRCIESVLKQTYNHIEIFVVDDGSTDGSLDYIKKHFPHINCVYQNNQGPAKARNYALNLDSFEWVAFLDADDWWEKSKIEKQLKFATLHSFDFVWSNGFYSNGNENIRQINKSDKIKANYNLQLNKINKIFGQKHRSAFSFPSSSFFKMRSFIDLNGYNKNLKYSNDYDLFVRAFCEDYKLGYLDEKLFYYYVNLKSKQKMTNQKKEVSVAQDEYWSVLLDNYIKKVRPDIYDDFKYTRFSIYNDIVYNLALSGELKESWNYLKKYGYIKPFFPLLKGLIKYIYKKESINSFNINGLENVLF